MAKKKAAVGEKKLGRPKIGDFCKPMQIRFSEKEHKMAEFIMQKNSFLKTKSDAIRYAIAQEARRLGYVTTT